MSKNNNEIKISFIGDIMCEMPLLKASKVRRDEYNFDKVFTNMKSMFTQSDYVVGNLETISAGKECGYTNHVYSFNSPKQFIQSIKKSGIDMVTTATNHSLDRGIKGLKANLQVLNKYELENTGTYITSEDRSRIFIKELNGVKMAFLNYTYGTNTHINGEILKEDELFHIGLLQSQDKEIDRYKAKKNPVSLKGKVAKLFFSVITLEKWFKIKKTLKMEYNKAYQDNDLSCINEEYLNNIRNDIKKAKSLTDLVVVCMHSGGQFHPEPGEYSKYLMNFMNDNGVDIVVGNHPHVVQKSKVFSNGMLGAYSLGNFSISPSSVYIIQEDLPDYSIMLHTYINKKTKEIERTTFSILKIVEYDNKSLTVYPIAKLLSTNKLSESEKEKVIIDSTRIYNRFLNVEEQKIKIKDEYDIH